MNNIFKINKKDNVAVALCDLEKGYSENGITLADNVPFGHKILLTDIKAGEPVIKYGYKIGTVTENLTAGSYIHSHNLKTSLKENENYIYNPENNVYSYSNSSITFKGYNRENGDVGVRNDLWIIPTVGCVNKTCEKLGEIAKAMIPSNCTGVKVITHPYGCSQMGDDQLNTQKILASLVNHGNAGGVLVVSLGCENNNLSVFKPFLGNINENRVKFLVTQNVNDEIETGTSLLKQLLSYINTFEKIDVPIEKLTVGFKCGGSDAFSGITANALCGKLTDRLCGFGAKTILTEVPEMFGAEQLLMNRCQNQEVFDKAVKMINGFKGYFVSHGQTVYENPSPGNKSGGITTLEEKSLGCVQKGGSAVITDVLEYGGHCRKSGLSLLTGPGNDIVSTTNLTAAGAHIILFTTGRGTPLGSVVPTVKISSNTSLFERKQNWIDFNAGNLIASNDFESETENLFSFVLKIASGSKTKNEINGCSEIAVFKDGVTM